MWLSKPMTPPEVLPAPHPPHGVWGEHLALGDGSSFAVHYRCAAIPGWAWGDQGRNSIPRGLYLKSAEQILEVGVRRQAQGGTAGMGLPLQRLPFLWQPSLLGPGLSSPVHGRNRDTGPASLAGGRTHTGAPIPCIPSLALPCPLSTTPAGWNSINISV